MEQSTDSAEAQLLRLGLTLPEPLPSFGEYVPAVRSGRQLWVGGHFGTHADGSIFTGKVGESVSVDAACGAARSAAINLLATVRAELGSLDEVSQIVRVFGVIDAASSVFVEVFGNRGRHARLAVGVAALPGDLVLEIEAVLDIAEQVAAPEPGEA